MGRLRRPALTGLLLLAAAAALHNLPRLSPGMSDWAEPGNVAAALAQGRGFSDPFDGGTGATAWVSPLPAWIEAAVFLIFGVKSAASSAAMLVLTVASLAATNALLLSCLRDSGAPTRAGASAAFLAACALLPGGPLEVLSEAPFDMLLATLLLWAMAGLHRDPGRLPGAALLAVALLAPLENAGVAVAVGLSIAWLALTRRGRARGLALPAAAAALSLVSTGGWALRNLAVLGRPIPLKSNGWFELHLANVDSRDGLPNMETVLRRLPFFDAGEFARYRAMGEVAYVDSFRAPALDAVRRDPLHFAGNVLRRLGAAVAFSRREGGGEPTRFAFAPADLVRLAASGELIPMGPAGALWARIDSPVGEARARIQALGLSQADAVWRDWARCRLDYDARYRGAVGLMLGFLTAGIPSAALLLAALLSRGSPGMPALWAAAIAAGMLFPYVLVNHNERHQLPILPMQAVAVGSLCGACARRVRGAGA